MKFKLEKETEETFVRWDIEADDELVEFAIAMGKEHVTDEDYIEIGMRYVLKQAVANAERILAEEDEPDEEESNPDTQ